MGRPLACTVTGGNSDDWTQFTAVMEAIRVPRTGPGRPRARPAHVLGDKGCSEGRRAPAVAAALEPVAAPGC
ncbi:hypothetical protein DY245_09735 [Streptomyces inhibens]|uniref:Transposase n=1 Tax=Streptomyces inhibens TaxID=2293571 RepID=A0A371Q780_STRIH|nr:hypothetical protein DY245_09735 [Streptomyces inhibens]